MKKVLIATDLKRRYMEQDRILDRAHIKVFTAETNDELLKIHGEEKVDLIVTKLDMPGIRSEEFFATIRQRKDLREALTLLLCEDTPALRERCKQCNATVVLFMPVDVSLLHEKVHQLLHMAARQAYRVTLTVAVEGKSKNRSFLYRTENLSATGVLVKAEEVFAQGDRISLSFFLPDGTHVIAHGDVARVMKQAAAPNACLYGIKFTDIDPGAQAARDAFIKKETKRKQAHTLKP
jgi:response regulator RpfG family c-di-GMP phosphodiesterase